ncbi:MAG: trehalose-phosphatase [Planctomycetes bacterium RIFCSPHIGHO2_02_FULL_38_41]|nr:MAG: trehalose-phosphatase [Planctomycetes bacterium RIFCSPHIGHO2_02_FULL_38_41]OHB98763.1 MAG: trehalose-phosphatase [Planctomycetes bacterium RIFCSPLOWO2_12_38_17]
MKSLFENIQAVNELLNEREKTILLTDFDGTLTPIQKHPDLAALSEEIRQILIKFSHNKEIFLGIITGRSLKQIKKLVHIRDVLYVANHGIELEGPGIRSTCPEAKKARSTLWHIYMRLFKSLKNIEGVHIEDKGLSISLHYRAVKKRGDVEYIISTLHDITKPFLDRKMLSLSTGKMVYEIRPPVKWNKASTIQWLLTHYFPVEFSEDALLIYLGDDKADIEVFDSLMGKGLTIFVGNPSDMSTADYYVNSPEEVKVFLEHLYEQKHEVHNECLQ